MRNNLKGKTAIERANIKATTIKETLAKKAKSFTDKKGRSVSIEKITTGHYRKGAVVDDATSGTLWVKILVDGKKLNNDGWYGFVNPPVAVVENGKVIIDPEKASLQMLLTAIGGD